MTCLQLYVKFIVKCKIRYMVYNEIFIIKRVLVFFLAANYLIAGTKSSMLLIPIFLVGNDGRFLVCLKTFSCVLS